MSLRSRIAELESIIAAQSRQIALLEAKVLDLLSILAKLGVKKDSHNSSLPPSSDISPSPKSLRRSSERKIGGQLGHRGTTLSMSSSPDSVSELFPSVCSSCGASLADADFSLQSKRQVVDVPAVKPTYTEYRQYSCQCRQCHRRQTADYPKDVQSPMQYGSSVNALVSYLSVYQHVPFLRLQQLLSQVFSLPVSQGSIGNMLERSAKNCSGVYARIKALIARSRVVGSDETGAKVNGKKWWLWVWQDALNTFLVASDNRGSATIDATWVGGLPRATLVSDRWSAQLKVHAKNHQVCLAHLLRDLVFLEETETHPFATAFKDFITKVFERKRDIPEALLRDADEALRFENQLSALLALPIDKAHHRNTEKFQRSIMKHRNYVLPCLYDTDIPPDNNGSERAIRNVKVKQKVSGQFKTGQNAYCVLRSVIDTLRKRNVEVLPCLQQIIQLQPV